MSAVDILVLLAFVAFAVVGSVIKRRAGERILREELHSHRWTDVHISYRPQFLPGRRARFEVRGRTAAGDVRHGIAYVGTYSFAPPISKRVHLSDELRLPSPTA